MDMDQDRDSGNDMDTDMDTKIQMYSKKASAWLANSWKNLCNYKEKWKFQSKAKSAFELTPYERDIVLPEMQTRTKSINKIADRLTKDMEKIREAIKPEGTLEGSITIRKLILSQEHWITLIETMRGEILPATRNAEQALTNTSDTLSFEKALSELMKTCLAVQNFREILICGNENHLTDPGGNMDPGKGKSSIEKSFEGLIEILLKTVNNTIEGIKRWHEMQIQVKVRPVYSHNIRIYYLPIIVVILAVFFLALLFHAITGPSTDHSLLSGLQKEIAQLQNSLTEKNNWIQALETEKSQLQENNTRLKEENTQLKKKQGQAVKKKARSKSKKRTRKRGKNRKKAFPSR